MQMQKATYEGFPETNSEMEDRIELYLDATGTLAEAIVEHRDRIAADCLAGRWSDKPLGDSAFRAEVKVEGQALVIELRKMA